MIIDAHTHMIHKRDLATLEAIAGPVIKKHKQTLQSLITGKPHATDVARRVAQMDRFGISYQLATPMPSIDPNIMPLDADIALRLSKVINESMARITEESKGRVLCAGTVPMAALEKGGLKEMERAIRELGLKGFSAMTNIRGKPLDAPEFRPFWARAVELGAVVFLHPANPISKRGRSYEADYYLMHVFGWPFETTLAMARLVFSGIMEEFGDLKIVTHHLGGMIPFYWSRMEEDYLPEDEKTTGVALKRPLKDYFGKFYYDTAVGNNPGAIRCTYELFGVKQLVFATDAPFGPGTGDSRLESYPRVIKELGLPERDVAKILGENARKILRIT